MTSLHPSAEGSMSPSWRLPGATAGATRRSAAGSRGSSVPGVDHQVIAPKRVPVSPVRPVGQFAEAVGTGGVSPTQRALGRYLRG
jgi:hypothetical protein